ncbi:helix-turn-helix domain-containing protein [Microvirga lotononidis]|uniref:Uncharacterized protein n=1 Tax=Microvirga lotononidis TaxID=864069 RepID=I4Z2F9_9HYPH|nr:helix-turn-helix domain-containing protein [Microvirga lotononidis]EIM30401.1 hypothetical protein MicloDRAFT_00009520 [Microvirga lotononidis]WQO30543.1 helix-turn-helix domain-containing protein [Microvirga lotononidis]WQO30902.1 helix-turn-helix domain-containing protein [Microvirga lotononidis]
MHPICLDALSPEQLSELDQLYHISPDPRVRIRALMILLSAERHLVAAEIAGIVRQHEETVRRWLARYQAEGLSGLAGVIAESSRNPTLRVWERHRLHRTFSRHPVL